MTTPSVAAAAIERPSLERLIGQDARLLSGQLTSLRHRLFPPSAQKTLRTFTSGEAAELIGISDAYLRQFSLAGETPEPLKTTGGRRVYTLEQINELRRLLSRARGARPTCPAARAPITCRSWPSPISRAARARRRQPRTWRSIWPCTATACWPSTSTRRRACRLCSGTSRRPTSAKTKRSTGRCATTTRSVRCRRSRGNLFSRARSGAGQPGAPGVRARDAPRARRPAARGRGSVLRPHRRGC